MTTRRSAAALLLAAALAGAAGVARAQSSASFKLTEHVFNAGGNPQSGVVLESAGHRLTLDSIAGGPALGTSSSASFRSEAGFASAYRPPAEIANLRFLTATDLAWSHDRSIGTYQVYRDAASALPGSHGVCVAPVLEQASWSDAALPNAGQTWFYLVTARNRLGEEGTRGFASDGGERVNGTGCP